MSENNPLLNGPEGRRDDGFGLPPTTGNVPIPANALPPSERIAAGIPATPPPSASAPPPPPPTRPAPPAPPPKAAAPKQDDSLAGVIDTFEAIVIALILALTFRAFVVEAFVIPTGSMAPTLLGAHFQVICPKCGHAFAENADLKNQIPQPVGRGELIDSRTVIAPAHRYCNNCGFEIDAKTLPDVIRTVETVDRGKLTFPWASNGDRILVLKYLYSVLSPQRYDVIVFKEPKDARDNYIKRLIGLPGETIEIVGGDIYAGSDPDSPTNPAKRYITRKPRHVQDALWQLVYDNDFYPIDEGQTRKAAKSATEEFEYVWRNPWSGDGWKVSRQEIRCDPAGGTLSFLPGEVSRGMTFYGTNVTGYNSEDVKDADNGQRDYVGDVHLETVWIPETDGAAIAVTLGKANNRWRVALQSDGTPRLEQWDDDARKFSEVQPQHRENAAAAKSGEARHIAMNNVDRRVEFYVDDKLVLSHDISWTAADAIKALGIETPHDAQERPMAAITTSAGCRLAHLKLMRDLYYTQPPVKDGLRTAYAGNPVTLGTDEFFALGDNSTNSEDGRMWSRVFPALDDLATRPGIVPRRYLLGKAFFVYWPAGFRAFKQTFDRPVFNSPIVPNTGEMRLIR